MKVVRRKPDTAYLDRWLWLPKTLINVGATQNALNFLYTDGYTGTQKVLALWKETDHHLLVPRAFWDTGSLACTVIDCRPSHYRQINFKSRIKLDHRLVTIGNGKQLIPTGDLVQQRSIEMMNEATGGVLQLACGLGKSAIALEDTARHKVPALVAVDNTNLLEQWKRMIDDFLEVPGGIGIIGDGHFDWKGHGLVLATYQTLASQSDDLPEEFRRYFGRVYFDEGHHVNAATFSRCADMFYGVRIALTATPERDDGLHIISDLHIGPVLYKDLRQPMKAKFAFFWTGLSLDLTDQQVSEAVLDKNKEIHSSKVCTFFGQWRNRMWMIMQHAIDALQVGRKILIVGNSVDEAVNLMTMWTRGPTASLYSDIPIPAPAEVGETLSPLEFDDQGVKKLQKDITTLWKLEAKGTRVDRATSNQMMMHWQQYLVHRKISNELAKRQAHFLKKLIHEPSTAGVMTFGVPPPMRQQFLNERQVIFAITKYGKEGLDCEALDTVMVSSLFSSRNGLQQLMGRPTRLKQGKKTPLCIFYVDDVGHCIGMANKLQKHMREWSHEEGGPFTYEYINYPKAGAWKKLTLQMMLAQ